SNIVSLVSSGALSPANSGGATALSRANGGVAGSGFNGGADNAYAFATANPSASFVSSELSTHSNVNAALGGAAATVFGAGTQGAFYSSTATGAQTYQSSIDWTLNATSISGHLIVGLLDNQTLGTGFTSLNFTVVEGGSTLVNVAFTTLATAQAFFTNDALDLGTFASTSNLSLAINFDLTTSATGSGFGENFLLGATMSPPPTQPVITAPSSATIGVGQPGPIAGVSIAESPTTSSETFTAVLADNSGVLAANIGVPGGGGTITSSNGGKTLTIVGILVEVNADLTTLTDTDASTAADTITISASGSNSGTATPASIAVTVNGAPVVSAPGAATVQQNIATPIAGVSVSETGNTTTSGETFAAVLADNSGVLAANTGAPGGGGTITPSNGGRTLTIDGTLIEVNADLTTLTDNDPTTGSDTITVNAGDSFGNVASPKSIAVTVLGTGTIYSGTYLNGIVLSKPTTQNPATVA